MLNAGLGFSDEFELEACNYSSKSSSKLKQHYKEWASTMKKEGSAFFKTVKSKVFLFVIDKNGALEHALKWNAFFKQLCDFDRSQWSVPSSIH